MPPLFYLNFKGVKIDPFKKFYLIFRVAFRVALF